MKILMISNMYPSKEFPSYGIFVKNFEEDAVNNNFKVDKIVMTKCINKYKKIFKYIFFYIKIIITLFVKQYDKVYIHYVSHSAIPVLIVGRFKNINIYSNFHGSDLIIEKKSQNKFRKYTEKIINKSSKIIVPSNYFKKMIISMYKINENKICVYPSGGINTDSFKINSNDNILDFKYKYNMSKSNRIIGYVGRIDPKKGWDIFIKTIIELVNKNLIAENSVIIVGNGSQVNELKKLIKKNKLNKYLIYFDLLPQNELNNIYNVIDILSFPTLGESLGLVGLEAMFCKCVVVGSDIEALREYIIHGKCGYTFNLKDYKEQARLIEKLLIMDEKELDNIKLNARKKASEYKADLLKNKLKSLLEE